MNTFLGIYILAVTALSFATAVYVEHRSANLRGARVLLRAVIYLPFVVAAAMLLRG